MLCVVSTSDMNYTHLWGLPDRRHGRRPHAGVRPAVGVMSLGGLLQDGTEVCQVAVQLLGGKAAGGGARGGDVLAPIDGDGGAKCAFHAA